jgi:hypothetical protein
MTRTRKSKRGKTPADIEAMVDIEAVLAELGEIEASLTETEQIGSSPNLPFRGMGQRSIDLIEAMHPIIAAAQPITGRGVGYKLFVNKLIASMKTPDMKRVYRLLKEARERGIIPWEWIVDEGREEEGASSWDDPEEYTRCVINGYRREYWNQQPVRVRLVSEKGTVRGILGPVLDKYGVKFRIVHGFTSATTVNDIASDDDGRPLILLYVGDWDPSGLCMSERDLPGRLAKYGGDHVILKRIALTRDQLAGLPSFPASDKKKDTRYKWFVQNYGARCWELDALDPNELRACVESEILKHIEPIAWERCKVVERAEQESLRTVMGKWKGGGAMTMSPLPRGRS